MKPMMIDSFCWRFWRSLGLSSISGIPFLKVSMTYENLWEIYIFEKSSFSRWLFEIIKYTCMYESKFTILHTR